MIWIPICGTLLKQEVGTAKSDLYNKWTKCQILHSVPRHNTVSDRYGFGNRHMYKRFIYLVAYRKSPSPRFVDHVYHKDVQKISEI